MGFGLSTLCWCQCFPSHSILLPWYSPLNPELPILSFPPTLNCQSYPICCRAGLKSAMTRSAAARRRNADGKGDILKWCNRHGLNAASLFPTPPNSFFFPLPSPWPHPHYLLLPSRLEGEAFVKAWILAEQPQSVKPDYLVLGDCLPAGWDCYGVGGRLYWWMLQVRIRSCGSASGFNVLQFRFVYWLRMIERKPRWFWVDFWHLRYAWDAFCCFSQSLNEIASTFDHDQNKR